MISEHFTESEWGCHCGCGQNIKNKSLIDMAESFRIHVNKPVIVHCVNRCKQHNDTLLSQGADPKSLHIYGYAVDCHVYGLSVQELHTVASSIHSLDNIFCGGLGYYDWGIHFDIGSFRTWGQL